MVDSGSSDRTAAIAAEFGVQLVTHPFESHAKQWQWALTTLPIRSPWILALDADQALTPELRASIAQRLPEWIDAGSQSAPISIDGRWSEDDGFATAAITRNTCSSCFEKMPWCSMPTTWSIITSM